MAHTDLREKNDRPGRAVTPGWFQIREDLALRTPEERERSARFRFWRKLLVMTLGILAMAMGAAQLFLR